MSDKTLEVDSCKWTDATIGDEPYVKFYLINTLPDGIVLHVRVTEQEPPPIPRAHEEKGECFQATKAHLQGPDNQHAVEKKRGAKDKVYLGIQEGAPTGKKYKVHVTLSNQP